MRRLPITLSLCLALAGALSAHAAAPEALTGDPSAIQSVALDSQTVIGGVDVACTGIGETRNDPKWSAWPVRVEFSNAQHAYETDAAVALIDAKGKTVLKASCEGAWLLLKPGPGAYTVFARLTDRTAKPRSARFQTPAHGQIRVVIEFPDA